MESSQHKSIRSRLIVISTILAAVMMGVVFAVFQLTRPRPLEIAAVKAVTVYFPLTYIINPILGEGREVVSLVPPQSDPHDFSPRPGDIRKALEAEVFFQLGDEPTAMEKTFLSGRKNPSGIIALGEGIDYLPSREDGGKDIHAWMSPRRVARMVENIQTGLVSLRPNDAVVYRARAGEFLARLQELDQEYRETLSTCERDTILVSHNAFAYLGRDYGFRVLPLYDFKEGEMSPGRMVEAIESVKSMGIPYLFYTSEANVRTVKALAEEIGVETLPLHTLENPVFEFLEIGGGGPKDYLTIMRANLLSISQSLQCKG